MGVMLHVKQLSRIIEGTKDKIVEVKLSMIGYKKTMCAKLSSVHL
jgi:hypothetical protein